MGIIQYRKGSKFEQEFAQLLSQYGFWATILPKQRDGSQPFDVQAQKYGKAYNFDCKTLERLMFPLNRIEENQEKAFSKLELCGCHNNYFAIKTKEGAIYIVEANVLIAFKQAGDKNVSPMQYGVTLEEWIEQCVS